jgi:SAM-dependent methyltransferase
MNYTNKIHNKIVTYKDLTVCNDYKEKNGHETQYPRTDDLWYKHDSLCKWTSHLMMFDEIKREGMKVVDLGVGDSPIPHIISNSGYDVVGVDLYRVNHPYQSLVVMVLKDAMEFLKDYEDNSVDVFLDGCAVTHFDPSHGEEYLNNGWASVCSAVSRVLKPGGYFISSSDIKLDETSWAGEFIIPEDIVNIAKRNGLALYSEFCYDRNDAINRFESANPGTLGVANFLFTKLVN